MITERHWRDLGSLPVMSTHGTKLRGGLGSYTKNALLKGIYMISRQENRMEPNDTWLRSEGLICFFVRERWGGGGRETVGQE